MACLKQLGFKSEVFHLDGQSWHCSTGLPSDVIIEVGETSFHLHKFPLLSRSKVLEDLIGEFPEEEKDCVLELHDIPGGAKSFLLVAKFCYGVKIELTAKNVVSLKCAAEYLQMSEDFGEGNLITQTEGFLNELFANWPDTIKALETCEDVLPHAEELHILSRCIDSLAMKACADSSLLSWPVPGRNGIKSPAKTAVWNGIRPAPKLHDVGEDWWYEDVSSLSLFLYKRLIQALSLKGMKPEKISGSIMFYANKYLPLNGRQPRSQNGPVPGLPEADQRTLIEEIVELLPKPKGITPTKFLLRLLRTAMILNACPASRENLEKRIGAQLDQAVLEDLLIPNMGYSVETLYDIDCVQRILDHFISIDREAINPTSNCPDEQQLFGGPQSLTPVSMVANLVDSYLAEVAPDVNLKLPKFEALAAVIPEVARPLDDGIYRAIDIYIKAHPWLTDTEKEQLCRLVNCQKLSLEASTHAAQNERLPLRVIVQVLFFEQLRLRTSVSGWFFDSDNPENSQNASGNLSVPRNDGILQPGSGEGRIVAVNDMKSRVSELEKECLTMKQELEKIVNNKKSWNRFCKMLSIRLKSKASKIQCNAKVSPASTTRLLNGNKDQDNGQLAH